MKIVMTSSPVTEVSRYDSGDAFCSMPMNNVLPKEVAEISTTAEAVAAFAAYKGKVKATGLPAVLCFFKAPRDSSRKPSGFDKASRGQVYVNLDKAVIKDYRKNVEAA